MEWAKSVDIMTGTATIQRGHNEATTIKLEHLRDQGLPRVINGRHTLRLRLRDGRLVDDFADDLCRQLTMPSELWKTHGIYTWDINGREYFIPALALMRAFFKPSRRLLAEMFRPQALDRICCFDFNKEPPALLMLSPGILPVQGHQQDVCNLQLKWMLAYPSAYQMASSVHRFGLQGRIDLAMPAAVAYVEVAGILLDSAFFVTRCQVMRFTPEEKPMYGIQAQPRFVLQRFRGHDCEVARHEDGSVYLTDHEWQHVRELIEFKSMQQANLARRPMVDSILEKLANATAWKNITYRVGTQYSAIELHRTLSRLGDMEKILSFLNTSRSSGEEITTEHGRW